MVDLTQTVRQPELSVGTGVGGPRAPLSRLLANRWTQQLQRGALDVSWPDGSAWRHAGAYPGPAAQIHVRHPRMIRRIALGGALGFADSYIAGDWDSPDLTAVLALGIENERALSGAAAVAHPLALLDRLRHAFSANSHRGSRRNIASHYDMGNEFYATWLDDSMAYSAGLFADAQTTLADAQKAKYARVAEMAGLRGCEHILEIGCGWGGFAIYAARRFGCRVTALTLSRAQAEWARRAVDAAGLSQLVEIRLQDYRDVTGVFDRIVSIEMFEAVGEAYWPEYFAKLRGCLAPGGSAAIQVITIDDARFNTYRRRPDFIQLRVFPGGMLPSPQAFAAAANAADLAITDATSFGSDYAQTLRHWRSRFEAAWPTIEPLGFDATFRRLWNYYLSYCEAGFDAGTVSVAHYRLEAG